MLDNIATYKTPEVERWLARHRRVHFHFTLTSASLPNQVATWFGFPPWLTIDPSETWYGLWKHRRDGVARAPAALRAAGLVASLLAIDPTLLDRRRRSRARQLTLELGLALGWGIERLPGTFDRASRW